jgi:hypothetical protein
MNNAATVGIAEAALAAAFEKADDAVDVVLLAPGRQDGTTDWLRAVQEHAARA